MSVANLLGRSSASGNTKLTFADGIGDVFVKSLNTAEITAFDPLLLPIAVEGGMDFKLTGGIEGLLAVETDALNSRTQQVAELSGGSMLINGSLDIEGAMTNLSDLDVEGNLTAHADINAEENLNISGDIVSLNHNNRIIFGSGVPAFATDAGSVYIRSDGGSGAQVLYVNHDGDALSWTAIT